MKPRLHFVPNVKFSRLQRSLKKIHSEELDSGLNLSLTLVGACNFSKCPASDLDIGNLND